MNKVNCAIDLAETHMEVFSDDSGQIWSRTPEPAQVTMRLSSAPKVFVKIGNVPSTLSGNLYNPNRISRLRLPSGPEIEARVLQVEGGVGGMSSLLAPVQQPVTVTQTGENLLSAKFNLINFQYFGQF